MLSASASTGLFITAFLIGATIVFSRRDLK
jgi:hypothetical protein